MKANGARREKPDFVATALEYVNENGMDSLTMRALGDRMGMHFTAVYRHYSSKEAMIVAMLDRVVSQAATAVPLDVEPAERLVQFGLVLRRTMSQHPALAVAAINTDGKYRAAQDLAALVVQALEELGLQGRDLVVAYRMIESHVVGTTVFDYAGAPAHLSTRRERQALMGSPEFDEVLVTDKDVAAVNEEAFERGLRALVASITAR